MKRVIVSIFTLLLATMACIDKPLPSPTPVPTRHPMSTSRNFGMGIAGLIPRNHPNSSDEDWINMYELLPETGELFGFYTAWSDSPETEGEPPKVVDVGFGLAPRYDFTPVVALSYFQVTSDNTIIPNINLTDSVQREKAIQTAVHIAEKYSPPYLALGVEVNSYYSQYPTDYENYLSLYLESYDAVKNVSPQTLVFPIFQFERLRGGIFFQGDRQATPQWNLIQQFGDKLDLIGLTTYPFLLYEIPIELPQDYYTEITNHTSKTIAFTEMGWPSAPLSISPENPFGGSEDEQTEFVNLFFKLTENLNLEFMMWSFPNDIDPNYNPAFTSISLRHNDGREKPALSIWRNWATR